MRFGTDGIRGVANVDLTPEVAVAAGRAAARVLGGRSSGDSAPGSPFVIGRDTRRSGPMLEAALVAGLTAEGVDAITLGVVPTPTVAFASQRLGVPGAVISASHNPFPDNGIKFFAPGGRKLPDALEAAVESELAARLDGRTAPSGRPGAGVGVTKSGGDLVDAYVEHVMGAVAGRDLGGMEIVVDCSNGAASELGPRVLRALGAVVTVINATPDGSNINAGCGSTDPAQLQASVVARGAGAGLAFDGDADRVIAVDDRGSLVDGDQILAVCAIDLAGRGALPGNALAVTVMSNIGLRRALAERELTLVETPVGDRHVWAAMEAHGLALGGEQSGHVIFAEHANTGDGILTGVVLLDAVHRAGAFLSELAGVVTRFPQVLLNVRVGDRAGLDAAEGFWAEVRQVEGELGDAGRVLVRPSGTEPVVRIMVEAPTDDQAATCADRLAAALGRALGEEPRGQTASEAL
ncbi:MAG: phosphoglucosamine mutase [Acidimicrobiia bacterium]